MKKIFLKIKKLWVRVLAEGIKVPRIVWAAILIVLIISLSAFGWMFFRYRAYFTRVQDPIVRQEKVRKQTAELIRKVSRHIVLPVGEEPKMATITDAEKLRKDQPDFYANAKNGDQVLIYFIAKKAFIYDPDNDIVVNIGPVFLEPAKN